MNTSTSMLPIQTENVRTLVVSAASRSFGKTTQLSAVVELDRSFLGKSLTSKEEQLRQYWQDAISCQRKLTLESFNLTN